MDKKYSEQIFRYPALTAEGKPCEILERITFERVPDEQGRLGEACEVHRRYDLRTGEPLNRLSDTEFENEESGEKLHLQA